jgi:hypothetical protein
MPFDKIQSDEQIPNCPYCDNQLDGPTVNGLHKLCHILYNEELDLMEMDRLWDKPFRNGSVSNEVIRQRNGGVQHQFQDDIGGCSANYR